MSNRTNPIDATGKSRTARQPFSLGGQVVIGLAIGLALAFLLEELHHWWAIDVNQLRGNARWITAFTSLGIAFGILVLMAGRWPILLIAAGAVLLALHAAPYMGVQVSRLVGLTVSPTTVAAGGFLVGGGVAALIVTGRQHTND